MTERRHGAVRAYSYAVSVETYAWPQRGLRAAGSPALGIANSSGASRRRRSILTSAGTRTGAPARGAPASRADSAAPSSDAEGALHRYARPAQRFLLQVGADHGCRRSSAAMRRRLPSLVEACPSCAGAAEASNFPCGGHGQSIEALRRRSPGKSGARGHDASRTGWAPATLATFEARRLERVWAIMPRSRAALERSGRGACGGVALEGARRGSRRGCTAGQRPGPSIRRSSPEWRARAHGWRPGQVAVVPGEQWPEWSGRPGRARARRSQAADDHGRTRERSRRHSFT